MKKFRNHFVISFKDLYPVWTIRLSDFIKYLIVQAFSIFLLREDIKIDKIVIDHWIMQINFSNQFIHPTRFFFSPETTNNRSQVYAFMQIYYNARDMQKEKKLLAYYSILYIITHFEEWNIFLIIKISNIKTSIIHKYLYDIRRIEKNIPSIFF